MAPTPTPLALTDNAEGALNATVSPSDLSLPLEAGDGAAFPQPYTGTASSLGSGTTLNSTGISAAIGGSAQVGKPIWNLTDNSIAFITTVSTNSLTTTALLGGTDNTWQSGDRYCIDPFVATLGELNTNAYGVQSDGNLEEVLVIARSTDTLTVASGQRGYNGTVARQFDAGDKVYLRMTSPVIERLKDIISLVAQQANTNKTDIATLIADLASTANAKGASLVGVQDAGGNYAGATVEAVLAEIDTRLDEALAAASLGFYGDGSDGAKTVSTSENLNPAGEFNYTTLQINSGQTLSVTSVNTPLVVKCTGDVTINGTIDLNGKGGAGGPTKTDTGAGNAGTDGNSVVSGWAVAGGAGGGSSNGNGGKGLSVFTSAMTAAQLSTLTQLMRYAVCGSGGGSGGTNDGDDGGAGGAGGGAMMMLVGGNLTLGASSVIRANGAAGAAGVNDAGDGSGGGGGHIVILVDGSITNSGATLSASGGAAGGSASAGDDGKVVIFSLTDGTLVTS